MKGKTQTHVYKVRDLLTNVKSYGLMWQSIQKNIYIYIYIYIYMTNEKWD